MKKRRLGWTGLELTVIGMGTWAAGGGNWKFGWGPQDDNDTIRAIHEAVDCGINWIDTAAVYGLGRSEEVTGRALRGKKGVIIATKCGRLWNNDGSEIFGRLKSESVKKECEDSLKRLGVETIDLYQMHWPQPEEDIEEAWTAMQELRREGKIRFAGVSNFSVSQLEKISRIAKPASLQPPYSLLRRDIEKEQLPYCFSGNIGVVCYSPMEKGLLTGKVTKEFVKNLPDTDHRKKDARFNEPELSRITGVVERLKIAASEADATLAQLAIAWVLSRPGITSAIAGARKPGQITRLAKAADIIIDSRIADMIENALK